MSPTTSKERGKKLKHQLKPNAIRRNSSAWRETRLRRHVPQRTRRLATNLISAQPGPLTYRFTLSKLTTSFNPKLRAASESSSSTLRWWTMNSLNIYYTHCSVLVELITGTATITTMLDIWYMFVVTRHFASFQKKENVRNLCRIRC